MYPSAATHQAASRPDVSSDTGATTQRATAGCDFIAASISPGSTLYPRTLTWSSVRPRNSSSPPESHLAVSPVR